MKEHIEFTIKFTGVQKLVDILSYNKLILMYVRDQMSTVTLN